MMHARTPASPDRHAMKILHIITRLILGGAQENTVLSCEGQAQAGHDVTLAFGPIYGPEGSLLARARAGGYTLAELPAMVRPLHPVKDIACYRQCRSLIRRSRPDVVHTHSSKAGVVARHAAWAERVPAIVHTIHGLPFHPHQSRLTHAGYVVAERRAAGRCHAIVTVADAMTKQALAAGVGRPEQYTTIHSGIEVEPYLDAADDRDTTRAALGIEPDDVVVGTVARLADLKGHDDLLGVLGRLAEPHPDLRYLWVGDGWRRARLERRIAAMGLADRVVLTGLVEPQAVARHLRAMDVLAHPSYREGLPRTLPQALLCGVPVVSYDTDGAPEVCEDGVTGRLAPVGDVAGLAEAIDWMVRHPAERRAMADRGRTRCARQFDHRVMVSRLLDLYRLLLQGKAPPEKT